MKINKAIEHLQKMLETYGDVEIFKKQYSRIDGCIAVQWIPISGFSYEIRKPLEEKTDIDESREWVSIE